MKNVVLFILLMAVLLLQAQDDFDNWLAEQNKDFSNWKSQQDKDFADYLKQSWDNYDTVVTAQTDTVPKPQEIPEPVEQENEDLLTGKTVKISKVVPPQPEVTNIVEQLKKDQMLYAVSDGIKNIRIDFWGIQLTYSYNSNMFIQPYGEYNYETIADYWGKISNTDFELLLENLEKTRQKFAKNDWAYCQIVYRTGEKIYGNTNMANLFTWFILTKSGFDCKVGYEKNNVFLLLGVKNSIYGEPHLVLDNIDYYCLSLGNEKLKPINLYTYGGEYPDANDLIDLNMNTSPYVKEVIIEKELAFTYQGNTWTIPVKQNKTLMDFLENYPATDLEVYFNSELSPIAKESLLNGLAPILEGRPQAEALNILLRFVQTAFSYQTDDVQFGEENSLFPDETLYYDYCDCEDRSFLFSYLVKELLGLNVIGLDFPGHIATAVQLDEDVNGDSISYQGRNYLVCDPTYINADIGVIMPQFANTEPRFIPLAFNP